MRLFHEVPPQIVHALLLTEHGFLCWETKIHTCRTINWNSDRKEENMRKLLTFSNSAILIVAFVSIVALLTPIAGAEITPAPGIEVEIYYVNPHG